MSISLVKYLKPFFKLMPCILRYTHEVIGYTELFTISQSHQESKDDSHGKVDTEPEYA